MAVASTAHATEVYRELTSAELKATFTGMEISELRFSEQYMRDRTVKIVTMGAELSANGRSRMTSFV